MTSIYKLKKAEYKEGASLAYINFKDLFEISEKAAELCNYGAASSLCVLALEELSKSIILQIRSVNNSIPIIDLHKYFSSHETKHKAAISIFTAIHSDYNEKETTMGTSIFEDKNSLALLLIALIVLLSAIFPDEKTPKNNKSFFDTIKETGFYISYDESSRSWKSPKSEHNQNSFEQLYEYIDEFAEQVENWIFNDSLNEKNLLEFLYSLDDEIIDKDKLKKNVKTTGNIL